MKTFKLTYIINNKVQLIMGITLMDALHRAGLHLQTLLFCEVEEVESCETYRQY